MIKKGTEPERKAKKIFVKLGAVVIGGAPAVSEANEEERP